MKGVWFSVCAAALAVMGVAAIVPSLTQAAGLTRAQVLAEIAGHRHTGVVLARPGPLHSGYPSSAPIARATAL